MESQHTNPGAPDAGESFAFGNSEETLDCAPQYRFPCLSCRDDSKLIQGGTLWEKQGMRHGGFKDSQHVDRGIHKVGAEERNQWVVRIARDEDPVEEPFNASSESSSTRRRLAQFENARKANCG